jgi:peptidoglycan/LPS O-acetylase OafA/YrhL
MEKNSFSQRNISFDFFRGLMAIMVCVGHFIFVANPTFSHFPHSYILAVDFFLVLSGFVIAASVLHKDEFKPYDFAKGRYLRLAPVYFFCIIATYPLYFIWGDFPAPNLADIIRVITISEMVPFNTRSEFPITTGFHTIGISYTISAELWVGILLFPIVYTLKKWASEILLPFLLVIIVFCLLKINADSYSTMNLHYGFADKYLYFGVVRCLMDYSIGIATFLILIESTKMIDKYKESALQILCVGVFCYLYLRPSSLRINEIYAPFLFALFIGSISKRVGMIYQFTSNRLGVFFGDISYPLYLIHPLFIFVFLDILGFKLGLNIVMIYLFLSVLSAYLINKYIEKTFMRYFKKRN